MPSKKLIMSLALLTSLHLTADEAKIPEEMKQESKKEEDVLKISEAFGHLIGKNIEGIGVQFDMNKVVKGLEDAIAGKGSPMNEQECIQAISLIQENLFKEKAKDNLAKAESFLIRNKLEKDVVEVETGKLQYKIEKAGKGAAIEDHFSPLIKYTGKLLDGTIFGASKEEEVLSLDETIPGFSKGMIGMKEGEKRILYIHPDLAYGVGGYLPPNSLLIFIIEALKANAPLVDESNSISSVPAENSDIEIADKLQEAAR